MTIYLLIRKSQNALLNFYDNSFIKIENTFIFIISFLEVGSILHDEGIFNFISFYKYLSILLL